MAGSYGRHGPRGETPASGEPTDGVFSNIPTLPSWPKPATTRPPEEVIPAVPRVMTRAPESGRRTSRTVRLPGFVVTGPSEELGTGVALGSSMPANRRMRAAYSRV